MKHTYGFDGYKENHEINHYTESDFIYSENDKAREERDFFLLVFLPTNWNLRLKNLHLQEISNQIIERER